jgi:hypothetical protein
LEERRKAQIEMEKLQRLKALFDDGVLTEDEYNRRKNDIIDAMLVRDAVFVWFVCLFVFFFLVFLSSRRILVTVETPQE